MALVLSLAQGCGTLSHTDNFSTDEEIIRYAQSGDLQAEVDSMAVPLVKAGQVPGIVVGVLLPDSTPRIFSYGVRDQRSRAKPDGQTIFPIGSISKGFVATVAAQLVQTGELSWNDTLEDRLPPDTPLSQDAKNITLLQLATHTAGLPRQPTTAKLLGHFIQYIFLGNDLYRHLDRDYLLRYLASFKAPSAPYHPQYSNIGFAYLSYVLELHTGKSGDDLLEEYVLQPLGLRQTGYTPENLPGWSNHAQGHAGDQPKFIRRNKPVPAWYFTDALRDSVGLYSCAEDLLKFARAHLHGNSDIRFEAALQDNLRRRADPPPFARAIAWTLDEVDGRILAYQTGVASGFTA